MHGTRMQGTHPGALPAASATHRSGRVCRAAGCTTALSIYNAAPTCWQHTDIRFPTYRGKRLQPGNA